jgi:glycerol-3-phosphate cytidylyltransferase
MKGRAMQQKTRVITYGTFDLFHVGHLKLLERAKSLGDELIVAVSTDEFNQLKGKKTIIPYEQRAQIVSAIKYVDKVIPEYAWDQKVRDIEEYDIDIFVMGSDWKGKFDFLKPHCRVLYLERTKDVSTTFLKESLQQFYNIDPDKLKEAVTTIESIVKALY